MIMEKEDFLRLLSRRLTDGLSADDEREFREAITNHQAYQRNADILTRYFQHTRKPTMADRIKLSKVWNTIEAADSGPSHHLSWMRAAAVVLSFIGFGLLIYHYLYRPEPPNVVEIQTGNEKQFVTLPDGSFVVLSKESSLHYDTDFGERERVVFLDGEAYFEAARNEKAPMVVHAGSLLVRVIGTTFQVHAYEDASMASVSLIEGAVEVSGGGSVSAQTSLPIRLKPLQKWKVDLANPHKAQIISWPKDSLMAELGWWPDLDTLMFTNERLEAVIMKLAKKFKVRIVVRTTALNGVRFSGELSNDVSLNQALEVLGIAYPFRYRMEGDNTVIIE